jgi:hypothetical protein
MAATERSPLCALDGMCVVSHVKWIEYCIESEVDVVGGDVYVGIVDVKCDCKA